jgi:hypothetical protein
MNEMRGIAQASDFGNQKEHERVGRNVERYA